MSELLGPVLEIAAESREALSYDGLTESVAERLSLTDEDLQETLPTNNNVTKVYRRLSWAIWRLKRTGFLDSPSRGRFVITPKGRKFLETHQGDITNKYLILKYEKNNTPIKDEQNSTDDQPNEEDVESTSPEESMGIAHQQLQEKLADDILDSLKSVSPYYFERIVVDLLVKMGYGTGQQVGRSGDGGIDGIINRDPLGIGKIYIQAKRWQNQVGEPAIRNFSGSLDAMGAANGVFITTSDFSKTAIQTAETISAGSKFIRLIDGTELAGLMIDHSVGVVTEITYDIKKLDENYFSEI